MHSGQGALAIILPLAILLMAVLAQLGLVIIGVLFVVTVVWSLIAASRAARAHASS